MLIWKRHCPAFSAFQSRLHPRLYQLCAGLCLWDKRCAQLCGGLLAAARHLVRYESHGPLFDRWLLGGHTNAWTISGTEDLKPYITAKDKHEKWLFGTVGMAGLAAVLAVLMTAFIH